MTRTTIIRMSHLGFPWETSDPFLFCAHHEDFYPAGNEHLGPQASLAGRQIGQDFTIKDGWRMYHGSTVPGFPAHPHRGFETVTVVQKGMVDHADSLGAAGRYGDGDVQWMTAGKGIQHAEMFPLLNQEGENPLEMFQIWLNLPKVNKLVDPHFTMLWGESIPQYQITDSRGKTITIDIIAGGLEGKQAPPPAPNSWAADPYNEVAIWTISLEGEATWTLPAASSQLSRSLYFFKGPSLKIENQEVPFYHRVKLFSDEEVTLENSPEEGKLLLLQGRPFQEPVAHYGPFVMNTQAELQQTFRDYQVNQFGGWPWSSSDPAHPKEKGRFARFADGTEEERSK